MSYRSFKDIDGNDISFESKHELALDEQTDIVTGDVTAYLVEKDDIMYQVDKRTYDAIKNLEM